MTDGSLTVSAQSYIGISGSGSFVQSGGSSSFVGNLNLAMPGGQSTYALSGTAQLSASTINVGQGGIGSFAQSGGTNSVTGYLSLGNAVMGSGTYTLTAGSLSVTVGNVGCGTGGSFIHSGGSNTTGNLVVSDDASVNGTYALSTAGPFRNLRANWLRRCRPTHPVRRDEHVHL